MKHDVNLRFGIVILVLLTLVMIVGTATAATYPALPECGQYTVTVTPSDGMSYFVAHFADDDSNLDILTDTPYDAFCAEPVTIDVNTEYDTCFYTTDQLSESYWGSITWLMNNQGSYNWQTIQAVIWMYTNDWTDPSIYECGGGDVWLFSTCPDNFETTGFWDGVVALKAVADTHSDYVAPCDGTIVVVVKPYLSTTEYQDILLTLSNECPSGCWITGGGRILNADGTYDSYGGNGMTMKDGSVRGHWNHIDHNEQNHFSGNVDFLTCEKVGDQGPHVPKAIPNVAKFGGTGTYNGEEGYSFVVDWVDSWEGGRSWDKYQLTIYDSDDNVVMVENGLGNENCKLQNAKPGIGCTMDGNLQIHPPNAGHPY